MKTIKKLLKTRAFWLIVGGLSILPGAANAQQTRQPSSGQSDSYGAQTPGQVVSPDVVKQSIQTTVSTISSRVAAAVSRSGNRIAMTGDRSARGLSAGNEGDNGIGLWANVTHAWLDKDDPGGEFNARVLTGIAGGDYRLNDKVVIGFSGTVERSNVDTRFNRGRFDGVGFSATPYFGYRLDDNFHTSVLIGYGSIDYDVSNGLANSKGGTRGQRVFGNASLTGDWAEDNFLFSVTLGWLQAYEFQDGFNLDNGLHTDRNTTRLGQISGGGTVGYLYKTEFGNLNPYLGAKLEYDAIRTPVSNLANGRQSTNDAFGTTFSVGVNSDIGDRFSLTVEGSTVQFRENLDQYTITGSLRYSF